MEDDNSIQAMEKRMAELDDMIDVAQRREILANLATAKMKTRFMVHLETEMNKEAQKRLPSKLRLRELQDQLADLLGLETRE